MEKKNNQQPFRINSSTLRRNTNSPIIKYGNSYLINCACGINKKLRTSCNWIVGPHWIGVVVTLCVIMGGTIMNMRLLAKNRFYSEYMQLLVQLFIALFFVLTNLGLILTAGTDPGIVFADPIIMDEIEALNPCDNAPYCDICSIHQPKEMNIYHCQDCNYCIESMDHHCPWMGQCIGKKNMR
eukprot:gene14075-18887_t